MPVVVRPVHQNIQILKGREIKEEKNKQNTDGGEKIGRLEVHPVLRSLQILPNGDVPVLLFL